MSEPVKPASATSRKGQEARMSDPVLTELEARADDLREKLAGRRPFAVPTDSFRRMAVEVGLRATEDAIKSRRREFGLDAGGEA